MKLFVLALLFCVVLFITGFIAPRRSRRLQARVDRLLRRGERKAADNAGRLGDLSRESLKLARRSSDKSAEAGRKLRKKTPG